MAVELDLNHYVPHPSSNETDLQLRERRNRERTYLVLFVHDRSLSMQTGRQWMLPEVSMPQIFPSYRGGDRRLLGRSRQEFDDLARARRR
jgi:hypothetical protein